MSATETINQLIILVVSGRHAGDFMQQLVHNRFYFTKIDSSGGGMLQIPTVTLLIGLNSTRLQALLALVNDCCHSYREYIPAQVSMPPNYPPMQMIEAQMGGALIYMLDIERFVQI